MFHLKHNKGSQKKTPLFYYDNAMHKSSEYKNIIKNNINSLKSLAHMTDTMTSIKNKFRISFIYINPL